MNKQTKPKTKRMNFRVPVAIANALAITSKRRRKTQTRIVTDARRRWLMEGGINE